MATCIPYFLSPRYNGSILAEYDAIDPRYETGLKAFDRAVAKGILSNDPSHVHYVGLYLYIGPDVFTHQDSFKHVETGDLLAQYECI